jgi:hypothetical protein
MSLFTFKQLIKLEITIEDDSLKKAKKQIKNITPKITLEGNQAAIWEDNTLILGLENNRYLISNKNKNLLREDQE